MVEEHKVLRHSVCINERKQISLSGVLNVKSFDEKEALLDTSLGTLILRGEGLKMGNLELEKGDFEIFGRVDSLAYLDKKGTKSGESFLGKMFR